MVDNVIVQRAGEVKGLIDDIRNKINEYRNYVAELKTDTETLGSSVQSLKNEVPDVVRKRPRIEQEILVKVEPAIQNAKKAVELIRNAESALSEAEIQTKTLKTDIDQFLNEIQSATTMNGGVDQQKNDLIERLQLLSNALDNTEMMENSKPADAYQTYQKAVTEIANIKQIFGGLLEKDPALGSSLAESERRTTQGLKVTAGRENQQQVIGLWIQRQLK